MGFSSVVGTAWLNIYPSRMPEPDTVTSSNSVQPKKLLMHESAAQKISARCAERPFILLRFSTSSIFIMSYILSNVSALSLKLCTMSSGYLLIRLTMRTRLRNEPPTPMNL